jgi:xylulose-5-phosphate/fructose-6-phosphate phosphoketolase
VVNVVDLMSLFSPDEHPHGMNAARFTELFTDDVDVVFAFHGYAGAVHQLVHGRPDPGRFHVRGYVEEGTTTTPFDMVVLNGMSRFHLAIEALKRARRARADIEPCVRQCETALDEHRKYVREHFDDLPKIREWIWRP